ncbi:MAG: hypothetical protein WC030_00250 [Candidatus Paceibacterota bacterium]
MIFIIVRAGAAEHVTLDDKSRLLTPVGIAKVGGLRTAVHKELSGRATQVITSPANRALHTAGILAPPKVAGLSAIDELYYPDCAEDRGAIRRVCNRACTPLLRCLEEIPGPMLKLGFSAVKGITSIIGRQTSAVIIVTHNPFTGIVGIGLSGTHTDRLLHVGLNPGEGFLLDGERFEILNHH